MDRKWVIRSSALMLVGVAGLVMALLPKIHQQRQTARYKLQAGKLSPDYFNLYDDQVGLKTKEQLRQEQQLRLKADLEDLARGNKSAPIFADVLYGDNWRREVKKYSNKMMLTNCFLAASVISILAGLVTGLTYRGEHIIAAPFAGLGRSSEARAEPPEKNSGNNQAVVISPKQPDAAENKPRPSQQRPPEKAEPDSKRNYLGRRQGQDLADSLGLKDSLGRQAQNFGKVGGQLASSVLMSTEPVANTLDELTQEVSAIREFASQQQDRVRQLQEGYDWTIVKRFCFRIIRCIDNLEERIRKLAGAGEETQHLEDVRDELLFALESSGVEQFEPQINADYRGLEKAAEAVHERQRCNKADHLSGKIAKVVRPGYHYVLNDNEVRIVRAAQVKLYL
ncbi:MAG TPA: hypothetical protein HPP87_06360 [Planctomycetes bacterium]|nr:hypothetical protein [Planctomycetota bacterium]